MTSFKGYANTNEVLNRLERAFGWDPAREEYDPATDYSVECRPSEDGASCGLSISVPEQVFSMAGNAAAQRDAALKALMRVHAMIGAAINRFAGSE